MQLNPVDEITLVYISEVHHYVRAFGEITTQWFFFGCTINLAIAMFLMTTKKPWRRPPLLQGFTIVCNVALVVMYGGLIPRYYRSAESKIESLESALTSRPETLPRLLPIDDWWTSWITTSHVLATIFFVTTCLWFYFFFTSRGREVVKKAEADSRV